MLLRLHPLKVGGRRAGRDRALGRRAGRGRGAGWAGLGRAGRSPHSPFPPARPPQVAANADNLTEAVKVKSAVDGTEYFNCWHQLCESLETLRLPVIAAIEGFCITGGLELALACDVRVAAEGSIYAITSARIGTVAGAGGTQRLPRLVGPSKALHLLMSAATIDGTEALRIGLVDRLVPKGGALEAALEWAAVYAERAPLSVAFAKRAVHRGMQMDLTSALEFETMLVTTVYGTADKQEGISAFLEKRTAKFTGH